METEKVFEFKGDEQRIDSKISAMKFAINAARYYYKEKPKVDFELADKIYHCFVDNFNLPNFPGEELMETAKALMAKMCSYKHENNEE